MTIYLSGQMTGIADYRERFQRAQDELEAKGIRVINPAKLADCFGEGALPAYLEVLKLDFRLIDMADAVGLLPGWENSRGCMAEYGYATGKEKRTIEL